MNKKILLTIGCFLISAYCFSQNSTGKETAIKNLDSVIFKQVEFEAEFPGGQVAWIEYLQKHLKANVPIKKKAPNGTYKVIVKFIVSKDGSISAIEPETNFGYGMEEEVMRVIRKGPNWTAAMQNGKAVNAYRRQPVTFVVSD